MKRGKLNGPLLKVLLAKQWKESFSVFNRRGKQFDALGFLFKLLLTACLVAVFVIFFSKFIVIFLGIKVAGVVNPAERQRELLTILYTVILVALIVHGVGNINKSIFGSDDLKIFSALPIDSSTLFLSKALVIYLRQVALAVLTVLPVNLTFAAATAQHSSYFVMTALTCLLLPLLSMAISSLIALPAHAAKGFLRHKFLLSFILVTLLTAAGFFVYSRLLEAVKKMLLGDELRYFFDARVMGAIAGFTRFSYPARWVSDLLLLRDPVVSGVCLAALFAVCFFVSAVVIRRILERAMQQKVSGDQQFLGFKKRKLRKHSAFTALLAKEFNAVFRTPGYVFGYFSVAVVMPIMVYFCMAIGDSLVKSLIFVDTSLELALFLTILFGVLTNTFCATNISREGPMFNAVRAMPVSHKQVFFSKVVFCFLVTAITNLISAGLLFATGYLTVYKALFVLGVGLLLGLAQICFATRKDFNHPRFSTEEDGEIRESNNTISTILVIGLLLSAVIGAIMLYYQMYYGLFGGSTALTWILVGGVAIVFSVCSYLYLIFRLKRKYYNFEGV